MEVGEEPVAGGGESKSIFSKSRHGVTGRVLDVVAVELEIDVGEEGQGPRQTGNIVAGSIDGENIIYESEHYARQFSGKCMTTNRPSKQETLDDTPGAESLESCEEEVFQAFVLDVAAPQVE